MLSRLLRQRITLHVIRYRVSCNPSHRTRSTKREFVNTAWMTADRFLGQAAGDWLADLAKSREKMTVSNSEFCVAGLELK